MSVELHKLQIEKAIQFLNDGKLRQSEKIFSKLAKMEPRDYNSLCYLSTIYQRQHKHDKAEKAIRRALQINPQSAAALNLYSNIKQEKGDFDGAEKLIRKALKVDEKNKIGGYINLSKIRPDDGEVIELLKSLFHDGLDTDKYIACCFCFGAFYDRQGDYEEAFKWFKKGNDKKRATNPLFRHNGHEDYIRAIKHIFTKENIENATGHQSDAPIFIVGMPRSGTTLTEQIISSHPEVTAGGELPFFTRMASETDFNEQLQMNLQQLGKRYLDNVDIKGKFTDKLPHNFHFVGLIKAIFPKAKIIHVRRDRNDCLLSCYQSNFTYGVPYANNWNDLNQYYDRYQDLMDHYSFLDIYQLDYEQLVSNPEEETRKLIDYCGLDWDEACLAPEKNKREVRTASVSQVRESVYTKSVGRFENYKQYLVD